MEQITRMMRARRFAWTRAVLVTGFLFVAFFAGCGRADTGPVSFASEILPPLRSTCSRCHNGREKIAGIMLDSYANIMKSRSRKSKLLLIQPGMPEKSLLYLIVASRDARITMPPHHVNLPGFTERQEERVKLWIVQGAPNN